jgi:hypothetical protein
MNLLPPSNLIAAPAGIDGHAAKVAEAAAMKEHSQVLFDAMMAVGGLVGPRTNRQRRVLAVSP